MIVWFILGPIGAGKTTFIRNHILNVSGNKLKYLSADILKERYELQYDDARNIMGHIMDRYIKKGMSFVTEGTGQHDDLYQMLLRYKQNESIELRITYLDVSLEIALQRNRQRDRVLDDETVRTVYENSQKRKEKWKEFNCQYIDMNELIRIPKVNFEDKSYL
jgi:predicted kinase